MTETPEQRESAEPSESTQSERLLGGHTGRLLVSLSLAWATLQLGRFLLSPLLPAIVDDLGVTTATAGLALGAFQLLYAVTQFPSGRVSDEFGRPTAVVAGLVAITGSFLLFAQVTTAAGFLAAALVLGLGKGLFAVPSRAQLSDAFVERRGQALGIYAANPPRSVPAYLATAKGFSEAVAAGVFAVVFVVGFAVKPFAGRLADRFSRRLVAAGGLSVSVAAICGVVAFETLPAVVAAVGVYAAGYKSVFPVIDALLLDAAPDGSVGGDLGAARAVLLGVGALGPVYLGWVVDAASYRVGFVGLGACLVVATVLLVRGLE